jgi:hypothetical protein
MPYRSFVTSLLVICAVATTYGTGARSLQGKIYATSAGDRIAFFDNGRAVEVNGNIGMAYAGQSVYFGEDGRSPRTECTYKQDGDKISLSCEGEKGVFTMNPDGSLTGPTEGMWKHKDFAHLTEVKKK